MVSFNDLVEEDGTRYKILNIEYTDETGNPIAHLFCRTENGEFEELRVGGHRPSFWVRTEECDERVENHHSVTGVEHGYTGVEGEELTRVFTKIPKNVGDMREAFTKTWEADVLYPNRFLIDNDLYVGVEVADDVDTDEVIHVDDIGPCEPPDVDPRLIIVDIEVASTDGFPDATRAEYPVSTIVAYDSYNDEYAGWLLAHDGHDLDSFHDHDWEFDTFAVVPDESDLLNQFNNWVSDRQPDLLSGWYSDGFDFPYLINRCRELSTWSYKDWSPMGEVWDGRYGPVCKGVTMFDMLDGYEKTQHHELDSRALDDVANDELGESKVELDLSHTEMWKEQPIKFVEYNKKDVSLVKDIEKEMGIIELYENMRRLTGAQFDDCHAPIDMLDVQFIRAAHEYGIVLPTATRPDQSWFYGAKVLDPQPGLHENVVYLDLSSLYPNLIKLLNISPEKILGFEKPDDIENVRWSYVDTRPQSVKEETEPEPEKFYYEAEESGFVSSFVDENIQLKEPYRGTSMYIAVKMVVNAIWGVLGDGDSYGRGFRLFDWRMGESITLAGRKVLQFTADKAVEKLHEMGYEQAYAVVGDSIPEDEPVLCEGGVKRADEVGVNDRVWTEEGWTRVNNVIEKPLRKDLYTVRTYEGVTHVTEDHSLLLESGEEVSPKEIGVGDRLLQKDVSEVELRDDVDIDSDVAWLYGFFAAEGSCKRYEYDHRSDKTPFAVNNADVGPLRRCQEIFKSELGIRTEIRDTMESSGVYKLQLSGNKGGERSSLVDEWQKKFYDKDFNKKVPEEMFRAGKESKQSFIDGYMKGDGYENSAFEYDCHSKSKLLAQGIALVLKSLGYNTTIDYRKNYGNEYYRIRTPKVGDADRNVVRSIERYEWSGETVYDFETENHHFQAGIGSIIVHNTDGVGVAIPSAEPEEAIRAAESVAEQVNDKYPDFVKEQFNADENFMEVEMESYASRMLVPIGADSEQAKKRHSQLIEYEDGEWLDEPDLQIKGLEYVRSDTAEITGIAQKKLLDLVLKTDDVGAAKNEFATWLSETVSDIKDGIYDPQKLGRPKGIGQPLDQYGSADRSPQPTQRGAKYANQNIYKAGAIGEGDKPMVFYVDRVGGDLPKTYTADTAEDGRAVDAITVLKGADLPHEVRIDYEKMIDKTLRDPLNRLLAPMGENFDDMLRDDEQADLAGFM